MTEMINIINLEQSNFIDENGFVLKKEIIRSIRMMIGIQVYQILIRMMTVVMTTKPNSEDEQPTVTI